MKDSIIFTLIMIFLMAPLAGQRSTSSMKYAVFMEADEEIVETHYQFITTKLPNGNYRFRKFYPEKMQLVQQTDFRDRKLTKPVGMHKTWYDNGAREMEVTFAGNKLSGTCRKYSMETDKLIAEGNYIRGVEQGYWQTYFEDGQIKTTQTYKGGQLDGPFKSYDEQGQLIWEGIYKNGAFSKMVSGNRPLKPTQHSPVFPGCGTDLSPAESYQCFAVEIVRYFSGNIRYRPLMKNELEGRVLVEAFVDEQGEVSVTKVLHGVSQELENEILRLIETMPRLVPGQMAGKATGMPVFINFAFTSNQALSR